MFKKKVLLALGMAAVLSTGCAATSVWAEENADVQAETESTDTEENSEAEGEAEEANPEIEEGYTTELDGCTKVVSWCKNGDNNIYGQFYYPADFDENQTYPVVIMSETLAARFAGDCAAKNTVTTPTTTPLISPTGLSRNRLHFPNDGACEMAGKSSTGRLCGLYL